ncbi:lysylphosphatidylglycerol synthase transmembrane domain-containing protein [Aestuariispira insulae]|uniref:Lysylphosphatidylglycerol synthase-like protein n=1 Tax=Aestuariispira insulae TaxID=1461337 RepID=A0A3D9HGA0_9PROT|nr:lysylphosphatidylglycerol synthase transmembrane domain-containing protein [Aestuariispira insulae]RED48503.1 hypothetical protein DFP90_1076 [Aestuariispira insulae]
MPLVKSSLKSVAIFIAKLAVTVALFYLIAHNIDPAQIEAQIISLDPVHILLAALLLYLQILLVSGRWVWMLRFYKTAFSLRTAIRLSIEGSFFNQALPSGIGGDAIRILRCRQYGIGTGIAVSSILMDRIVGLAALLMMALAAMPAIWAADPMGLTANGAFMAILIGFAGLAFLLAFPFMPEKLRRPRAMDALGALGERAALFLIKPKAALPTLCLSLLSHACTILAMYQIGQALGTDIPPHALFMVAPVALLIIVLPVSVGGWGLREGTMIQGLAIFNVANESALTLSILFGLLNIVINIPGGLLWLAARKEETAS